MSIASSVVRSTPPAFVLQPACGPDRSSAENEFMAAMQRYKQQSGRMFPTWSEVLEVLRDLGYQKPAGPSTLTCAGAIVASD